MTKGKFVLALIGACLVAFALYNVNPTSAMDGSYTISEFISFLILLFTAIAFCIIIIRLVVIYIDNNWDEPIKIKKPWA